MSRKLTHEQFIERLYERNKNAENIEILEKYQGSQTKIKCRCKIDNHEWTVKPNNLLNGKGCPMCYNNRRGNSLRKTHEEFIKELAEINPNIEILGGYINTMTKILCKCKIDNHIWESIPSDLLNSYYGCPKCANRHRNDGLRKTHEEFIKELAEINPNIEVLGKYVNNITKILCKCKIDNHIWESIPTNLLRGKGCSKCNSSKGEKAIVEYLERRNIENISQYKFEGCKFKYTLPFDFYIPRFNVAIEYDGRDHYEIFTRSNNETYEEAIDRFIDRKIRDTIKTIYCKENNIKLIRIPYWEFDNIENILDKIFLK